jgi:hypothetical protein
MQKQFHILISPMQTSIFMLAILFLISAASAAAVKTLIDYFQPTPIYDKLSSTAWGAAAVGPRDIHNGLEDTTMKQWQYWDGKIIKGPDGKYHMFASRWDQSKGMSGWGKSAAVHAVSDKPTGPYVDKGICYPDNQSGKGHNVTATVMPDGRYAIIVSDTRPGDVFVSSSLDGPWTYQGTIQVDANGFDASGTTKNLSLVIRADGSYLMATRFGAMMLSTTGIMGPYKVQGPSVYQNVAGLSNNAREDPCFWYSGGQYHMVVNWYNDRKAYHMTSPDGIKNWKLMGLAYDPTKDFVRYTDGTVNHWYKMERLGVLIENGHVTHFTLAVIDVDKSKDLGNDTHGTKVIVIPFDGIGFDGGTPNLSNEARLGDSRALSIYLKGPTAAAKKTFFVPSTSAGGSVITITLYDIKGRLVSRLHKGPVGGEDREIRCDLDRSVSAGVYCITFRYGQWNYADRITIQ